MKTGLSNCSIRNAVRCRTDQIGRLNKPQGSFLWKQNRKKVCLGSSSRTDVKSLMHFSSSKLSRVPVVEYFASTMRQAYLQGRLQDDDVPGGLEPRLTVHLNRHLNVCSNLDVAALKINTENVTCM